MINPPADTHAAGQAALLQGLGIDAYSHSGGSLSEHLLGTAALLEGWGCAEHVVLAGLIHSIYGTESYARQPASFDDRRRVGRLVGRKAERLAYVFGVMEKHGFYSNLLAPVPKRTIRSRLTHRTLQLGDLEFVGLAHIVLANWLEQRSEAPPAYQRMRGQEFWAMRSFLLPGARASLDEAYEFGDD